MIPVLEVKGLIAILITILLILIRLYFCFKLYNDPFIIEILSLALFTSIIWLIYGIYRSHDILIFPFIVTVMIYTSLLFWMGKRRNIKN